MPDCRKEAPSPDILTAKQRDIALRMAAGECTTEIAFNMKMSNKTVDWHRAVIYRKLGMNSPVALAHWALTIGLIKNKYAAGTYGSYVRETPHAHAATRHATVPRNKR